jgi:hypothetical protein
LERLVSRLLPAIDINAEAAYACLFALLGLCEHTSEEKSYLGDRIRSQSSQAVLGEYR